MTTNPTKEQVLAALGKVQEPELHEDLVTLNMIRELKIEGGYIEKLVLEDKNHQALTFENPDEIIKLPVGQYRLLQVFIIGGYSCGFRTTLWRPCYRVAAK